MACNYIESSDLSFFMYNDREIETTFWYSTCAGCGDERITADQIRKNDVNAARSRRISDLCVIMNKEHIARCDAADDRYRKMNHSELVALAADAEAMDNICSLEFEGTNQDYAELHRHFDKLANSVTRTFERQRMEIVLKEYE